METCSRSLEGLGREQTSTQRETLREHWKRPRVVDLRATKRGLYPLQLLIHYRIAGDAATLPGTLGRFLPTSVPSLGHALCPLTPLPTPPRVPCSFSYCAAHLSLSDLQGCPSSGLLSAQAAKSEFATRLQPLRGTGAGLGDPGNRTPSTPDVPWPTA